MSGEQKFKEGDSLAFTCETTNRAELMVFTDKQQVYKTNCAEFEDGKASLLGDYLPAKLQMDEGESVKAGFLCGKLAGNFILVIENGKVAKVEAAAYATKSNRRRLTGAYSDKSPVRSIFYLPEGDKQVVLYTREGRALIFSTAQLAVKSTRNTQGVGVMSLKKKDLVDRAALLDETAIANPSRYRVRSIPAAGAILKQEDTEEKQIVMDL